MNEEKKPAPAPVAKPKPAEKKKSYVFATSGKLTKPNGEVLHYKAGDSANMLSSSDIKNLLANGVIKAG